jgi:flagellar protein FliT
MPMNSQEIVSLYEAMVGISDQMVQAANDSDWDRLVLLEQQCAVFVGRLRDSEPQPLAGRERVQKVEAIRKMLDADRKIRDLADPWMVQLTALISNTGTERRLARAYGT